MEHVGERCLAGVKTFETSNLDITKRASGVKFMECIIQEVGGRNFQELAEHIKEQVALQSQPAIKAALRNLKLGVCGSPSRFSRVLVHFPLLKSLRLRSACPGCLA